MSLVKYTLGGPLCVGSSGSSSVGAPIPACAGCCALALSEQPVKDIIVANKSHIASIVIVLLPPSKNPVVNVRENIVTLLKLGKPFSAYVITPQSFIDSCKIPERAFDAVPGII